MIRIQGTERSLSCSSEENEVFLVIQVNIGDGRSGTITVNEHDNASSLSQGFCDTYGLSFKVKLALQKYISQQIQLALQQSDRSTPEQSIPFGESRYHLSPVQIPTAFRSRQRNSRKIPVYERLHNLSRSNSPVKEVKSTSNKSIKPKQSHRLYYQGLRDKQIVERRNQAIREQRQEEQMKSFTFKPRTNSMEQSRGVAPQVMLLQKWEQRNQKLEAKRSSLLQQQMEPCTFSPNIDKKSKKIVKKEESPDRFVNLYEGAKRRQEKISEKSQKLMKVMCPFNPDTRLTNNMNRSVLERKESSLYYRATPEITQETPEELFKPKIGRPPRKRNFSPKNIGEHLYSISMRSVSQQRLPEAPTKLAAEKSDQIIKKLKLRRYRQIFQALNPYEGVISSQSIQQSSLPDHVQDIIYPLLDQLISLNENLSFEEFCQSMQMLMKVLSPAEKNLLLNVNKQTSPLPQYSFKPQINKTGKIESQPLYQRALKKKQAVSQKIDSKRLEKAAAEMVECTFQPAIKDYKFKHSESFSSFYWQSNIKDFQQLQMESEVLSLNMQAMAFLKSKQFQKALECLKKAEEQSKDLRLLGITYNNYSCLYKKTKKFKVALQYLKKALTLQKTANITSSEQASTHLNLSVIFSYLKSHNKSLFHANQAINLLQNSVTSKQTSYQLVIALINSATQYQYLNKLHKAVQLYTRAKDLAEDILGVSHKLYQKTLKLLENSTQRFRNYCLMTQTRNSSRLNFKVSPHVSPKSFLKLPPLSVQRMVSRSPQQRGGSPRRTGRLKSPQKITRSLAIAYNIKNL